MVIKKEVIALIAVQSIVQREKSIFKQVRFLKVVTIL